MSRNFFGWRVDPVPGREESKRIREMKKQTLYLRSIRLRMIERGERVNPLRPSLFLKIE